LKFKDELLSELGGEKDEVIKKEEEVIGVCQPDGVYITLPN